MTLKITPASKADPRDRRYDEARAGSQNARLGRALKRKLIEERIANLNVAVSSDADFGFCLTLTPNRKGQA